MSGAALHALLLLASFFFAAARAHGVNRYGTPQWIIIIIIIAAAA
jgi:hypothetical protein